MSQNNSVISKIESALDGVTYSLQEDIEYVVEQYFGVPFSEVESAGGSDEFGVEHEIKPDAFKNSILDQCIWGYTDTFMRTIHCWRSPQCDDATTAHFLGHELMHVVVFYLDSLGKLDSELREELMCEATGLVCKAVHKQLAQLENGVKNG
jgi:hypothetical protein